MLLRAEVMPYLPLSSGGQPQGAMRGKPMEFASHTTRLFFPCAKGIGSSSAVVFADSRAVFYSVFPEYVRGALLPGEPRGLLFQALGLRATSLWRFEKTIRDDAVLLAVLGVPAGIRHALADWHGSAVPPPRHARCHARRPPG